SGVKSRKHPRVPPPEKGAQWHFPREARPTELCYDGRLISSMCFFAEANSYHALSLSRNGASPSIRVIRVDLASSADFRSTLNSRNLGDRRISSLRARMRTCPPARATEGRRIERAWGLRNQEPAYPRMNPASSADGSAVST